MFLIFSLMSVFVIYGYPSWRVISHANLPESHVFLAWFVVASIATLPHLYIGLRSSSIPSIAKDGIAWATYVSLGFAMITFSMFVIRDVIWLAYREATRFIEFSTTARSATNGVEFQDHVVHSLNLILLVIAGGTTLIGFVGARRKPTVTEVQIPIHNLPQGLRNFRIVQLSDIHVGPTIKRAFVQKIVDTVSELDPDLIALTGDLADGSVSVLEKDVAPLGQMKSRHGNFFVTGNHDYYSGIDQWLIKIKKLGFRPLLNEHHLITHQGGSLVVAGVTDISNTSASDKNQHKSDPEAAFRFSPTSDVRILLAHQPKTAESAHHVDFHLQLSGHTHGGQFIPWKYLIPLQQPFVAGLHRLKKNSWIYVSRGTGYWGPPIRLGASSEISLITLVTNTENDQ
tara:strand:+ start:942 stop:2138 length:1197 start_codon:yes stop_codon:yes gene_type:complete